MAEVRKALDDFLKKIVEKQELNVVVKNFEKTIKNLHSYVRSKFTSIEDTDDAMLSKRPLLTDKCASCERGLKNIINLRASD